MGRNPAVETGYCAADKCMEGRSARIEGSGSDGDEDRAPQSRPSGKRLLSWINGKAEDFKGWLAVNDHALARRQPVKEAAQKQNLILGRPQVCKHHIGRKRVACPRNGYA